MLNILQHIVFKTFLKPLQWLWQMCIQNTGRLLKLQVYLLYSPTPPHPRLQRCSELRDYKTVIFALSFCGLPSDSINGWVKPLLSNHLGSLDTTALRQWQGKPFGYHPAHWAATECYWISCAPHSLGSRTEIKALHSRRRRNKREASLVRELWPA